MAHGKQGLPLLLDISINDPIKSRGTRAIGTHNFLDLLCIVQVVGVVVELNLVLAFKVIAGKIKFRHGVARFNELHTTYFKEVSIY